MDKITLKDLRFPTTIGVHAWEQAIQQQVILHIEFVYDTKNAVETDDITHAVDYYALAEYLKEFLAKSRCNLIEALAHNVVDILQETFKLSWIKLELTKPHALDNAQGVSITVEKGSLT